MADTLEFWRKNDGCQPRPATKDLPDPANDGTSIEVTEYQGCKPGSAVRYMEIVGGGHTWPGSPVPPESRKVGRVTKDIDGSQYIWDFFRSYQLPQ
jgi:polyhydroxybutyrate depolymerase